MLYNRWDSGSLLCSLSVTAGAAAIETEVRPVSPELTLFLFSVSFLGIKASNHFVSNYLSTRCHCRPAQNALVVPLKRSLIL